MNKEYCHSLSCVMLDTVYMFSHLKWSRTSWGKALSMFYRTGNWGLKWVSIYHLCCLLGCFWVCVAGLRYIVSWLPPKSMENIEWGIMDGSPVNPLIAKSLSSWDDCAPFITDSMGLWENINFRTRIPSHHHKSEVDLTFDLEDKASLGLLSLPARKIYDANFLSFSLGCPKDE